MLLAFISVVNISEVDLNLLHVLHAVLEERSATRAAKRLHVTQSAVSNGLARLRQVFGDPLVVRNARGLSPTPFAQELQGELAALMASVTQLVSRDTHFEPSATTREFTLACADYVGIILAPALGELLRQRAAGATLRLVPLEQLSGTVGLASNIDVHVGMPPKLASGCKSSVLFKDRFVCLVKTHGSISATRLTLNQYLHAGHVRVSVLGSTRDPIDLALGKRQLARHIALTVPHFSIVPSIVEELGYVATLSRRLAERQVSAFAVSLREPPLWLGERSTSMVWHERTHRDEGARFFRNLIKEACSL